jgi:hypothetical protein
MAYPEANLLVSREEWGWRGLGNVSRDAAAARDLVRRTGQMGVPVLDIGGKIVVGFNRPQIDALLELKKK